jgi:hypothetical protein
MTKRNVNDQIYGLLILQTHSFRESVKLIHLFRQNLIPVDAVIYPGKLKSFDFVFKLLVGQLSRYMCFVDMKFLGLKAFLRFVKLRLAKYAQLAIFFCVVSCISFGISILSADVTDR